MNHHAAILVGSLFLGLASPLRALPEIAPPLDPAPSGMEVECLCSQEQHSRELLLAVLNNDQAAVEHCLTAGADPDMAVPHPVPEEISARFPDGPMHYYIHREQNVTALMLAAATGNLEAARALIAAGADRHAKTRRNKTFALQFAAREQDVDMMRLLMDIQPDDPVNGIRIRINLHDQLAALWEQDELVLTSPISSGKRSKPTPPGRYVITNKYVKWKSTIYHVRMPYFMRLSCGEVGLHAGHLPGYPASSGCIRLPEAKAREFFERAPVGTLVEIDSGDYRE